MNKTLAFLIVSLLTASTLPINATADATQDIPTNAAGTGIHDSLVAALTHVNLVATLQGPAVVHRLCPYRPGLAAAGIDLDDFDTDEENATLTDILLHHVLSGSVAASDVTDGMMATMVNGDNVKFGVSSTGTVTVGAATVTLADVQASNGVIHVIDTVLMPPTDIPTTAQSTWYSRFAGRSGHPSRLASYPPRQRSVHGVRSYRPSVCRCGHRPRFLGQSRRKGRASPTFCFTTWWVLRYLPPTSRTA